ncbi:MAG: hypothetical protein A2161_03720 [Candidatus Schekmanbacteria bacterium RBG_13_48_7]|uniref:Uncharacterized protein n=1 Tax=Candidatus Schekmanbacteria bacterium RBG_13_48_7 TaxID=1817878 RepID=A0A1F7RYZ2_9BACT|nr:MAG: hypothetical protein A2161_03720 [Candidatus Schekmanbacteria bacterium RBG_13_48_7]
MDEKLSINSLRDALKKRKVEKGADEKLRFEAFAKRYEKAVHHLINQINKYADQIPEFTVTREDETEIFTSPAFPGYELEIKDQRLKITLDEDFLLFDPTAKALTSALGQVKIISSKPIPFLIENILYLIYDPRNPKNLTWGYRSIENFGGKLIILTEETLLKLFHAVFA